MNMLQIAVTFMRRLLVNKRSWFVTFILPACLVALMMNLLIDNGDNAQPVRVVDDDQSVWSQTLIKQLHGNFKLELVTDYAAVEKQVAQGEIPLAVHIPSSYGDSIASGGEPHVQLMRVGMSEQIVLLELELEQRINEWRSFSRILQANGEALTSDEQGQQIEHYMAARPELNIEDNHLYPQPTLRYAMGIMIMFILMTGMNSISVMLEDKKKFTMLRMYAAPVRRWEISAGYFMGSFLYGSIQIILVLIVTRFLLGIDMGINIIEQWLLLELFLASGIGAACMLATLLPTESAYTQIGSTIIVPACMLGGAYWPISIMEPYMQQISYVIPQRWLLDAIEKLASGASLSSITLHLGILILFTIIFISIGSIALRPAKQSA